MDSNDLFPVSIPTGLVGWLIFPNSADKALLDICQNFQSTTSLWPRLFKILCTSVAFSFGTFFPGLESIHVPRFFNISFSLSRSVISGSCGCTEGEFLLLLSLGCQELPEEVTLAELALSCGFEGFSLSFFAFNTLVLVLPSIDFSKRSTISLFIILPETSPFISQTEVLSEL
jgi:hypothetical protein